MAGQRWLSTVRDARHCAAYTVTLVPTVTTRLSNFSITRPELSSVITRVFNATASLQHLAAGEYHR